MTFKELSPEVLVVEGPLVLLTRADIDDVKARSLRSPRRRARICAHPGVDDAVHEMIIALAKGCYIRPHRHVAKSESYHIVSGRLDIVMFDDAGVVIETIRLGTPDSGESFFYRNNAGGFHTVVVRSDVAVFHETTKGPFTSADTIPAAWAPEEGDDRAAASFLAKLGDAAL